MPAGDAGEVKERVGDGRAQQDAPEAGPLHGHVHKLLQAPHEIGRLGMHRLVEVLKVLVVRRLPRLARCYVTNHHATHIHRRTSQRHEVRRQLANGCSQSLHSHKYKYNYNYNYDHNHNHCDCA